MPPTEDFASELRRARTAAGLSQAQVASRAGLTGSYVCVLELRRKPAPAPDVVAALARAIGVDPARLQELAALERTPEPVRQRVLRLVKERGRVRRSRDRLLTTTLFHMTRRPGFLPDLVADALGLPEDRRLVLGRLTDRVKALPSVRDAEEKSSDLLREVAGRERDALVRALPRLLVASAGGAPARVPAPAPEAAGRSEERPWRRVPVFASVPAAGAEATHEAIDSLHLDRRLWRPGAYVLVADDDDAFPRVEKGDWVLLHPDAAPTEGALVVVRDAGRARIRVYHRTGEEVRLDAPRFDVPPLRLPLDRFAAVGVVAWILRPLAGPPPRRPSDT